MTKRRRVSAVIAAIVLLFIGFSVFAEDDFSDDPNDPYDDDAWFGEDHNGDNPEVEPDHGGGDETDQALVEAQEALSEAQSDYEAALAEVEAAVAGGNEEEIAQAEAAASSAELARDAAVARAESVAEAVAEAAAERAALEVAANDLQAAPNGGTLGDPVRLTSGSFYLAETDLRYGYDGLSVSIRRNYESERSSSHSFGRGWVFSYDTRIVRGSERNGETLAVQARTRYLETQAAYIAALTSHAARLAALETVIAEALTAQERASEAVATATTALQKANAAGGGIVAQAQELLSDASAAKARIDQFLGRSRSARTDLLTSRSDIDALGVLVEQLGVTADGLRRIADLSNANISADRFVANASDPDAVRYVGNGKVTLIDESGAPHLYSMVADPDYGSAALLPDGAMNYYPSGSSLTTDQPNDDSLELLHDGSWIRTAKDGTRYEYNHFGQLTSARDRNGSTLILNYAPNGGLRDIRDEYGRVTAVSRANGRVVGITDPIGRTIAYGYDGQGRLISVRDRDGDTIVYTYEGDLLTSIVKPDGSSRKYSYGDNGSRKVMVRMEDEEGNQEQFRYYRDHTAYLNALGIEEDHYFDARYRTTKIIYPDGSYRRYEYDERDNLVSELDELGRVTQYSYDERRNLTKVTDDAGLSESWTYTAQNKMARYVDRAGRTTTYSYDGVGNLTRVDYPDSSYESFSYDGRGRLVAIADRRRNETTIEYDQYGSITALCNSLGDVDRYENDAVGRVLSHTDPTLAVTKYEYNGDDRVTAITDAKGGVERYEYNERKDLVKRTDRLGNETNYFYDRRHLLLRMRNPLGEVLGYEYRADGRTAARLLGRIVEDASAPVTETGGGAGTGEVITLAAAGELSIGEIDGTARTQRLSLLTAEENSETTSGIPDALLGGTMVAWESRTEYGYDERGNATTKLQVETGILTSLEYDSSGRVRRSVDGEGGVKRYSYDYAGRIVAISDPLGYSEGYEYTATGKLAKRRDKRGYSTLYRYDAMDRLVELVDAAGGSEVFRYDANGNLVSHTDKIGAETRIEYDAANRKTRVVDALGRAERYEYDARGLPTRRTDRRGAVTAYAYDELRQLVSETDAKGKMVRYAYDAMGSLVSRMDRRGNLWSYGRDALGRVRTAVDPYGNKTTLEYDIYGNIDGWTNAMGERSRAEYDAAGRPVAWIDPLGERTSYGYDGRDLLVTVTDPTGRSETYSYDELGRLTIERRGEEIMGYEYDADGNRVSRVDAGGAKYRYEYDRMNRLIRETDRLGATRNYEYDVAGRLVAKIDFEGDRTEYSYDAVGRLVRVEFPDGSREAYEYDATGNLVGAENAARGYEFEYDALGRITKARDLDLQEEVTYAYDEEGNRTRLSWQEGRRATSYAYGAAGELLSVRDNEGGTTVFSYDQAMRETRRSLPNGLTTLRGYDPAGRLTKVKTEGGGQTRNLSSEAYVYDPSGRRTYTVDELGRITAYRYDAAGRLSEVLYPFRSGKVAGDFEERISLGYFPEYEKGQNYDSPEVWLGFRLPSISAFDEEAFVGELESALSNQEELAKGSLRLSSILEGRWKAKPGEGATSFAKRLEPAAEEVSMLRAAAIRANGRNANIDVRPWLWDEMYRYDERGNRLSKANGWGRIDYRYDAENRLLQAGEREYDYDGNGNLRMESLGSVSAVYEYDYKNRLVDAYSQIAGFVGRGRGSSWSLKAGVRYEYDAFGRRVSRAEYEAVESGWKHTRLWDPESATNYLYDGFGMEVLGEARDEEFRGWDFDPPWMPWFTGITRHRHGWTRPWPGSRMKGSWGGSRFTAESEYVYGNGKLLERLDFDPRYRYGAVRTDSEYYTQDILGSTMMLTDRQGVLRERYEYDAYGTAYEGSFRRLNGVGYTGKRLDPSTGLIDYGFRDYGPKQGRFTTVDPIKDGGNWYAYCGNDPVNYTDPTGLVSVSTMLRGKELKEDGQALQVVGGAIVAGTVIEDIVTGGAGTADDPASVSAGLAMMRSGRAMENLGRATLEAGVVEGNSPNADSNSAARVKGIFASLPDGNNPGVKVVKSEADLQSLFNDLADGGSLASWKKYDGVVLKLADGTSMGYRLDSDSRVQGTAEGPTIDIRIPGDKTNYKVHICNE